MRGICEIDRVGWRRQEWCNTEQSTQYEGPHVWETTRRKLRYVVNLPEQPPDFATAPANPERPVRIHFVTHITMGGVDIYRL